MCTELNVLLPKYIVIKSTIILYTSTGVHMYLVQVAVYLYLVLYKILYIIVYSEESMFVHMRSIE